MRKTWMVGLLLVLCTGPAQAQTAKVFLNNKAFTGKTSGSPGDIMVEASTVITLLGLNLTIPENAPEMAIDDDKLPITWLGNVAMIRAKDLVQHYGGKYQYARDLGAVDIYAYDPVLAARKALTAVLKQRKITNESDFDVLVLLTRQILTRDLGLKLDSDAQVVFSESADIAKAGGSDAGTFVTYHKEAQGAGTARYRFMVRKGLTPVGTVEGLAWAWGFTWANLQGTSKKEGNLPHGFAEWVSYKAIERLVGPSSITPRDFKASIRDDQVYQLFLSLLDTEKLGGIEGVIHYVQEQSKGG